MAQSIDQPAAIIAGLAVTVVLGLGVSRFLEWAVPQPTRPTLLKEDDWKALTDRSGYGDWLGFLERLLSFATFAISEFAILGGWLAFKLAAKWEVWKNIVQVPSNIEGIPPLTWFQARSVYSSWLLSRFLIGTLANILIGLVGVQSGLLYCRYIKWCC